MPNIIRGVEQGTQEWLDLKIGKPSTSNFAKLITTKGERSTQYKKYMYELAGEIATNSKEQGYKSADMDNGTNTEDEARDTYTFITDNEVEQVTLVYKDEAERFLCSPDGLVGDEGLVEIKCPKASTQVGYLEKGKLPTTYFQQVQGQLYVTERKWCDFFSYVKGMKPLIVRVYPDKDFHKKLEAELGKFCDELDTLVEQIKE